MKRLVTAGIAVAAIAVLLWASLDRPAPAVRTAEAETTTETAADTETATNTETETAAAADAPTLSVATLAGGCFWCTESTFEKIDGVHDVVSGYTAGHTENPTYPQVGGGGTGHTEAVQIHYDPAVISFEGLLHYFWREIDPTDSAGQFVDRGSMYRPAIFYHNEREKTLATASRDQLQASGRLDRPVTIEITPAQKFYEAEHYHQDYYKTNPYRYKIYRHGSGRDQFLERVWGEELHASWKGESADDADDVGAGVGDSPYGKPADSELKQTLTEMQYQVTQHEGTEPPFRNEFWDNKQAGIYVDIVSGEPLFSSTDKFRSGTGWPSFSRPLDEQFLVQKTDYKLIFPRVEVRSKYGDSHLGHLFNDGPAPTGLRYCINSASLRFIAAGELQAAGYGEYVGLFE